MNLADMPKEAIKRKKAEIIKKEDFMKKVYPVIANNDNTY